MIQETIWVENQNRSQTEQPKTKIEMELKPDQVVLAAQSTENEQEPENHVNDTSDACIDSEHALS